jgi:DNA-binding Lrp family transcriptional regulator
MLDETDLKILRRVLKDARMSYRRIADEIDVSPPTVLSRVQKLERDRIIKSYSNCYKYVMDLTTNGAIITNALSYVSGKTEKLNESESMESEEPDYGEEEELEEKQEKDTGELKIRKKKKLLTIYSKWLATWEKCYKYCWHE